MLAKYIIFHILLLHFLTRASSLPVLLDYLDNLCRACADTLRLFAFPVSTILYTAALVSAPLVVSAQSQFFAQQRKDEPTKVMYNSLSVVLL